jgi:hypothetical protein
MKAMKVFLTPEQCGKTVFGARVFLTGTTTSPQAVAASGIFGCSSNRGRVCLGYEYDGVGTLLLSIHESNECDDENLAFKMATDYILKCVSDAQIIDIDIV